MGRLGCLLAIGAVLVAGCNNDQLRTYPVEGRVTFPDGKPLEGGTVEFQPIGEQSINISARGRIQPDGTFRMSTFKSNDGAIAGEHRALVVPGLPPGRINPFNVPEPVIHERFQRYETSGLTFTVTPRGTNVFEIIVEPPQ